MNQNNFKNFTDEQFKEHCSNWKASDWENYLSSTETPQKELLLEEGAFIDNLSNDQYEETFNCTNPDKALPYFKSKLDGIIAEMTEKQKEILRMIFWEQMSLQEISVRLGITKQCVHKSRNRAFTQITKKLMLEVYGENRLQQRTRNDQVQKIPSLGLQQVPQVSDSFAS